MGLMNRMQAKAGKSAGRTRGRQGSSKIKADRSAPAVSSSASKGRALDSARSASRPAAAIAATTEQRAAMFIIKTHYDTLYARVLAVRKISLQGLAREMGVSSQQVETWALQLQGQGIVEVVYPPVGAAYVQQVGAQGRPGRSMPKAVKLVLFAIASVLVVMGMIYVYAVRYT